MSVPSIAKDPIPSDLKAPGGKTPWRLSSETFDKVKKQTTGLSYQKYELDPQSKEAQFVTKCFLNDPPPDRSISRIFAIFNHNASNIFENAIPRMEKEAKKEVFKPKWRNEINAGQRQVAFSRWEKMVAPFKGFQIQFPGNRQETCSDVYVVPLWHGSKKEKCDSACDSGLTFFGKQEGGSSNSTDMGYFGSGIYGTPSAKYALGTYSDGNALFVWFSMREPYPVVSDVPSSKPCSDMKKFKGQGAFDNYNGHYIPVVRADKTNEKCAVYHPCFNNESPECDEFVVFKESQTLIAFWVEAGENLKSTVKEAPLTVGTLLNCLYNLLGNIEVKKDLDLRGFLGEKLKEFLLLPDSSLVSPENQAFYNQINRLLDEQKKVIDVVAKTLLQSSTTLQPVALPQKIVSVPKEEKKLNSSVMLPSINSQAMTPLKEKKPTSTYNWRAEPILMAFTGSDFVDLKDGTLAVFSDKTITLWDAQGRCIKTLNEHKESIQKILGLRDGTLASFSKDKTIIWDNQGNCLKTLPSINCSYKLIELKDGTIAGCSYGNKDGKIVQLLDRQSSSLSTFQYDSRSHLIIDFIELNDGTLASWSKDNNIRIWNKKGNRLNTLIGHPGEINGLVELKDGTLASCSDFGISWWDKQGNLLKKPNFLSHGSKLLELKDGTIASYSYGKDIILNYKNGVHRTIEGTGLVHGLIELKDGCLATLYFEIKLWDSQGRCLKTFDRVKTIDGKDISFERLIELKDGTIASWSWDKNIRLWDRQGNCLSILTGHISEVRKLIELREGLLASCSGYSSGNEIVLCWRFPLLHPSSQKIESPQIDFRNNQATTPMKQESLYNWSVKPIVITISGYSQIVELQDGILANSSSDYTIKFWDRQGNCRKTLSGHTSYITKLSVLKDGTLISFSDDKTIKIWDRQGNCLNTITAYGRRVQKFIELKDGTFAIQYFGDDYSSGKTIKLYNRKGNCFNAIGHHSFFGYHEIFNFIELNDGTLASYSEDKTIKLWDQQGKCLTIIEGHTDQVCFLRELSEGILVSSSKDKTIKLWNRQGICLKTLIGHTDTVVYVLELKDGTLASSSSDKTIKFWDKQGNCTKTLTGNKGILIELKNGTLASSSFDKTIKLLDKQGNCLKTFEGDHLIQLKTGILASCMDCNIHVWDAEGNLLKTLTGHTKRIYDLKELEDGILVSYSYNSTKLWQLS